MKYCRLQCQVCSTKFTAVFQCKRHMWSLEHTQKMKEIFPKDVFKDFGFLPHIAILEPQLSECPMAGLSMVTFCFTQEKLTCFYLCHICEEKCSPGQILHHISSGDHYSNCFSCKDPNVLYFSWMPQMIRAIPWSDLTENLNDNEQLQMLQLPTNLLDKLASSTYSEVMNTLSENDRLLKIFEAVESKRMPIQSYQRNSLRKHSLLGMQHLVECICVGPGQRKHYLCTLCSLTVACHMIIKHVLSFDHIFCYFKAWHPSTLLSKECYRNYSAEFKSMMVDLAKQTEKINGTANTDMKQVNLEPAEFKSVNFTCYAKALKKLESIKKISLTITSKPGNKLVPRANTAPEPRANKVPEPCRNTAPEPRANKAPEPRANTAPEPHPKKAPEPCSNTAPEACGNKAPELCGNTAPEVCGNTALDPRGNTALDPRGNTAPEPRGNTAPEPRGNRAPEPCGNRAPEPCGNRAPEPCGNTAPEPCGNKAPEACGNRAPEPCANTAQKPRGNKAPEPRGNTAPEPCASRAKEPHGSKAPEPRANKAAEPRGNTAPEPCANKAAEPRGNTAPEPRANKAAEPRGNTAPEPCANKAAEPRGNTAPEPRANKAAEPRGNTAQSTSKRPACKLLCQDCSCIFEKIYYYIKHLSNWQHREMMKKYFGAAAGVFGYEKAVLFHLGLHTYINMSLKQNQPPPVGASLVVTCVTTHVEIVPIYVCFACQDCFPQPFLKQHFNSRKHLIHTLLYLNPWRLPVAWVDHLDDRRLRDLAIEEEKEIGSNQMILKVLDIPASIFWSLTSLSYADVMAKLELYHTLLKCEVPQCQTYRKLQQNERFPLLGIQFLVKYDVIDSGYTEVRFLCLLCERKLSEDECYIHVISWEHVAKFLKCFHPGSLDELSFRTDNAEAIVDLAKQAGRIHPISHVQEIDLHEPIWEPASYHTTTFILQSSVRKHRKGTLKPPITPGVKLVPRKTLKEVDKDCARGNSRNTNELCAENGPRIEKGEDKETPPPSEKESEIKREAFSRISSEEMKNAGETCQVETEKTEESPMREPTGEIPENCQKTGTERSKSGEHVVALLKNYLCKQSERKKSQDTCPNEELGREMGRKRQRLNSREDTPCEEFSNIPNSGPKEENTADMEESHKPDMDKGLRARFECPCDKHDPVHLCERCSLKIPEKDVTNHQKVYQEVVNMDIDDNSENPEAAEDMPAVPEIPFRTTKPPPESNKDDTMKNIKVPKPADSSHSGTNTTRLPSDSTGARGKAAKPRMKSTGDAAKLTSWSAAATSQKGSTVVQEATCRTLSTKKSNRPKVGLNHLITVRCGTKMQIYCRLCSVRLLRSHHLQQFSHQYNYVKWKYPGWTATESDLESKLNMIVIRMAEVEKAIGARSQIIEVKEDVYAELRALPEDKALERVKGMVSSSSTASTAEAWRKEVALPSSCEVSSSNDVTATKKEQEQPQSIEGNRSLDGEDPQQADGLIQGQLRSCPSLNKNNPELISAPNAKVEDIAVIFQQEHFDPDVEAQAHVEVSPVIQSRGVNVEKPHGCAEPVVTDSDTADTFTQIPDTSQDSPVHRQQQRKSDPKSQDTQKVLDDTQETSHVEFFGPDPRSLAATVNTEQQNHPRPSHKAEHEPKHCPGPGQHTTSQALPTISIGEKMQGPSHLLSYLKVKELDAELIIGRGFVWECRGISPGSRISVEPFYLCESCEKMLSLGDICQHMVSHDHQVQYMLRVYPQYLWYWSDQNLTQGMKWSIFKGVAERLSEREQDIDAQVILLRHDLFEGVRAAPFSEALKVMQSIKNNEKLSIFCLPTSAPQQKSKQLESQQSHEESLPTEEQSARALETDQKSDDEAQPEAEKPHLEETLMVGDLGEVKERRVLSPLDVNCSSSESDSVVSPFLSAGMCPNQPGFTPPVSLHQRPVPKLQVEQAEVNPESPPLATGNPNICKTLSVFPKDKCLPTRKRPAETSVETLVTPCDSNPLEDALPAKRTPNPLQPVSEPSSDSISESTFVNPAATHTPMSPKHKDTGPGSDIQNADNVKLSLLACLLSELKAERSKMNKLSCKSAPDNADTISSSVTSLCESEGQATGAIDLTDTIADLQNVFGNANQFRPSCAAISPIPGQTPQIQPTTQTDRTGICQLPINTIITTRPDPTNHKCMGSYKEQDPTEVTRGHQVPTASLSNMSAASGLYSPHSQMVYVANGNISYVSCGAVSGYATPRDLPVSTGSLHGLSASQIYPEQAVNSFSLQSFEHSLATPMSQRYVSLEIQQQQQQQCSLWTRQWESDQ